MKYFVSSYSGLLGCNFKYQLYGERFGEKLGDDFLGIIYEIINKLKYNRKIII